MKRVPASLLCVFFFCFFFFFPILFTAIKKITSNFIHRIVQYPNANSVSFHVMSLFFFFFIKLCSTLTVYSNVRVAFKPLNSELNPICYLLALLAQHFLHVSRIMVKSLTLRLLMSYIYIYIERLFLMFLDHTRRRTTVGRTPLDE